MIRAKRLTDASGLLDGVAGRPLESDGLVGPAPTEKELVVVERASEGARMGLWSCGAYEEKYESYPVDELMVLVSGTVELVYSDGSMDRFTGGDAFLLPRGFAGTWRQPDTVVKYFAIVG